MCARSLSSLSRRALDCCAPGRVLNGQPRATHDEDLHTPSFLPGQAARLEPKARKRSAQRARRRTPPSRRRNSSGRDARLKSVAAR